LIYIYIYWYTINVVGISTLWWRQKSFPSHGALLRPRAADFSQDLQQELSSAGRRRSVMAAQGTLDRLGEGWEYPKMDGLQWKIRNLDDF
jgi:hypothetical protein